MGTSTSFRILPNPLLSTVNPFAEETLARDTIAVLYSAYVSAERRGTEIEL